VELDEKCRFEAELGNFYGIDEQTRLIRRYRSEAVRRADKALKELRRLQEEAERLREEEEEWEDKIDRERAARVVKWSPVVAEMAEREAARSTPQPPQEAAGKPVQAPAAAASANPTPAGAETRSNPQAEELSPGPGQRDGFSAARPATGPQPPRAESYVQKAAHRTCN
jgi:hypothetical protein